MNATKEKCNALEAELKEQTAALEKLDADMDTAPADLAEKRTSAKEMLDIINSRLSKAQAEHRKAELVARAANVATLKAKAAAALTEQEKQHAAIVNMMRDTFGAEVENRFSLTHNLSKREVELAAVYGAARDAAESAEADYKRDLKG